MFVICSALLGVIVWIAGVAASAAATTANATTTTRAIASRGARRSRLTAFMSPLPACCALPSRATLQRHRKWPISNSPGDREHSLHAGCGMAGNGAEVVVLPGLLEDDRQLRRLL